MQGGVEFRIHPSIGIGRVGNSHTSYYLAPESIGGLPIEPDHHGNPQIQNGQPVPVASFKDEAGMIRRQAAVFRIYRSTPDRPGEEELVDCTDEAIDHIEWTVHVANKKAAWWNFIPLLGDLMFGPYNSYDTWTNTPPAWNLAQRGGWTSLRNGSVQGDDRQALIIDPGPHTLTAPERHVMFNKASADPTYPFVSFPDATQITQGLAVQSLGEMRTDSNGNLLVLGAYGRAGGAETITGFGGGDTWHDDIADGPVTATIHFKDPSIAPVTCRAWVVIGSPKYAPQLVNISTWDDVATDVAIRTLGARPDVFDATRWPDTGGWNPDYHVNYDKDIAPFLLRIADYQWVATVPSMTAFIRPACDPHDMSEANRVHREAFLRYFRRPSTIVAGTADYPPGFSADSQNLQLFSDATEADPAAGIPLVPMNAGTNSVRNNILDKFSELTATQYYLLSQWAAGKAGTDAPALTVPEVHALDHASIGNCVGEPMCPGIEVTWSVRNPVIYERPFVIRHRHPSSEYYYQHGLSSSTDECEPISWERPTIGHGCEPGDLTKRMAIPWQADFFDCSVQMINFTRNDLVKDRLTLIPVPPTYYAYWWPPQSPWNVITGDVTLEEQKLAGVPAGMQVMYSRGVNSFTQMISAWKYLGFIVNRNMNAQYGRQYPYFVERERNHDKFAVASVGVGNASSFITGDDSNYLPAWFLKDEDVESPQERAIGLGNGLAPNAEPSLADVPKPIRTVGRRFGH